MHPTRIAELLKPFLSRPTDASHFARSRSECDGGVEEPAVLLPPQLQDISTYIDILQRWNSRINLTAIRDEEEIVTRHFGESLFAARHLFPNTPHVGTAALGCPAERSSAIRVADLGSGAGFPGLPIKLWAPEISLTLIESNQKKASFLREVVRVLTLTNVDIQNIRAEDLSGTQTFDAVTLRAVEHFNSALPLAASLLTPTGRLALLIGSSQEDQACSTLRDFSWQPIPVPKSKSRVLLMGERRNHEG